MVHKPIDAGGLELGRYGQYRASMSWEHAKTVEIAATPIDVYNIVSSLERMGEWSPENTGGSWILGNGTNVGDRFEGNNAIGDRTWSAVAEVVRCDPGSAFCFTVGALDNPVAECWQRGFLFGNNMFSILDKELGQLFVDSLPFFKFL